MNTILTEQENTAVAEVAVARPVTPSAAQGYRPKLRFYHPTGKGTGCALEMELHPAHDLTDGSIWMSVANQMTVGDRRGPNPTFPRFDWENKIVVKLDFTDLCKMLQVFRGECENLEDGRGLFHRTARASTKIVLRHLVDPVSGYSLELYRTSAQGDENRAHFMFMPSEALGLAEAIAGSMAVISFGIPRVIPHDTSAYEAANRERRNASAA